MRPSWLWGTAAVVIPAPQEMIPFANVWLPIRLPVRLVLDKGRVVSLLPADLSVATPRDIPGQGRSLLPAF